MYNMRRILVPILTLLLNSCFDKTFDKNYYEKITGIKLPDNYHVLQTFDNGEFLNGTVFQFDSTTLQNFMMHYQFDTLQQEQHFSLLGNAFFDKQFRPAITSNNRFFLIQRSKEKNTWTYLVDLTTNRLWAEVQYPDWSGQ